MSDGGSDDDAGWVDRPPQRGNMIVKKGKKYLVKTSDGSKVLGTHDNQEDALAQLQATEIAKKGRAAPMKGEPPAKGYFIGKP